MYGGRAVIFPGAGNDGGLLTSELETPGIRATDRDKKRGVWNSSFSKFSNYSKIKSRGRH
jgi:hypothetical protein